MTRLARVLERYGPAVEADLAFVGIDVGTEWRARRWRRLLNLIDHLPRNSYYVEALADDEELAEMVLESPHDDVPTGPRMSQWSPEAGLLAEIVDRLAEVASAVVASAGGAPGTLKPYPRPRTAADRVQARRRRQRHDALVRRVLPD